MGIIGQSSQTPATPASLTAEPYALAATPPTIGQAQAAEHQDKKGATQNRQDDRLQRQIRILHDSLQQADREGRRAENIGNNEIPRVGQDDGEHEKRQNTSQHAAAPGSCTLEQQAAGLVGFDPITGADNKVAQALADQAEMALLHMISHDPARTPNFTLFGNPDYFLFASSTAPCAPPTDSASCFVQSRDNVWNHGDFQKEIVRT
jgi:hypothetical protein